MSASTMSPALPPACAIVSPSYRADFERCQLLVESVQTLSQTPLCHYIIVDQRDYSLFKPLASTTTKILIAESVLAPWIYRIPWVRRAWFSLKSPPIRNWMIQQMIKLSFAKTAPEPITIFVDSDVVFIRPFSLATVVQAGRVRLFREPDYYNPIFEPFYRSTARLLRIEGCSSGMPRPNYIGNLISWRQSNVMALCDRLEQVSGRPWLETLAWARTMSEYMLYGVFVDQVMGESAGHFHDQNPLCHAYWLPQPMDDAQMSQFFAATPADTVAVMISAKARISPSRYIRHLHQFNTPHSAVGTL
jgi:hypothetical protein